MTNKELRDLWDQFEDVPMNPETECIEDTFHIWPAGTHREEIWHWFDERYDGGVHALLYGDEQPKKASLEEKKAEAVRRMKAWGIYPPTIRQFEQQNLISESAPPLGACFWVEGEQLQRVRDFEKRQNALVYHVIHSYTNIGELESYLYVSDYPEEWDMDREDIKEGQQIAYVYNHDMPDCSELGAIGVELTLAAGLRRTW